MKANVIIQLWTQATTFGKHGSTQCQMEDVSLKVNDLISVKSLAGADSSTYPSRVDDLVEDKIIISWPTDQGVRVILRLNDLVTIYWIREDAVYSIDAKVEERDEGAIPKIILHDAGSPKRDQRRTDFRVTAPLSVEITGTTESTAKEEDISDSLISIKTRTVDISGGGLAIHHSSSIPVGTMLEAKLILPDEVPGIHIDTKVARSQLVSLDEEDPEYHIGVAFVSIKEQERKRLIRYLFKVQTRATTVEEDE